MQLLQENAEGHGAKGFRKIKVDNIHGLFLIHQVGKLRPLGLFSPELVLGLGKGSSVGMEQDAQGSGHSPEHLNI